MGRNSFLWKVCRAVPGSAGSAGGSYNKGIIPGFPVANRAGRALAAAEQSGLSGLHSSERAAGRKEKHKKRR